MYTREEFEQLRIASAEEMAADRGLHQRSLDLIIDADRYYWIHQSTWLGEPCLQLPQDMFALQEIIFRTRPKFIIEVGAAWGGSTLFYSTMMEILGGERIIAIDIYIPEDVRERITAIGSITKRVTWINGSSIAQTTIDEVKAIIGDSREVLVILDSHHSHEHVLKELQLYSPIVGKGYYLICGDTIVEQMPEHPSRSRPWGPGDSPKTALDHFLKENDRFEVDRTLENKLLLTCNPGGYLRCIKE